MKTGLNGYPCLYPWPGVPLGLCNVAICKDTLPLCWCSLARYTAQQISPCLPPSSLSLFLLIHRTREVDATVTPASNDKTGTLIQVSQRQSSSQLSQGSTTIVTLEPPGDLSKPAKPWPCPGALRHHDHRAPWVQFL